MRAPLDRRSSGPIYFWMSVTLTGSLLIQAAPLHLPGVWSDFVPLVPLMTLFLWSARRPEFTPPWLIFVIGVFQDLLTGGPLGIWPLAYLVAFGIARPRDEEGSQEIGALSIRFAILCAIALLAAWLGGAMAYGELVGGPALLREGGPTILLFPLFAWIFGRRRERSSFF